MSDYRRCFQEGGIYFFTVVAYNRRPILTTKEGRRILKAAILKINKKRPFKLFATVLLPDHWHLVMQLPYGDDRYSIRIKQMKEEFSREWLKQGLPEATVSASQKKKGERGIWQPRFWEHTIEDEDDLVRCVDYIHWNPRKHDLVAQVKDWKWSSFFRFVKSGDYEMNWGGKAPQSVDVDVDWGEPG